MSLTRRLFLGSTPLVLAPVVWPQAPSSSAGGPTLSPWPAVSAIFPTQAPELAQEMVRASHADLPRVKDLLALHPTLARAAWDWGFGDWEDALGAASHVGNRAIAGLLIANGARPTLFSATMLGQLDVVKAFIAAQPGIEATPGPHGITLLSHAKAGGSQSQPVADYLMTLPGASKRPDAQPIKPDEMKRIVGDYVFGPGPTDRIAISMTANNALTFTRMGRDQRNLFHVGDLAFYPSGAPLVRIRFRETADGMRLTVHDPDLVLEARRA